MKSVRYSLIYKFFASQIRFGYYKKGNYLPSIELLQRIYHASSRTVRNAYLQLQSDGYVSVSPGRRTIVIFDASPEECTRFTMDYYLAREEALRQLTQALRILFLPLLREGSRRLQKKDMRSIREFARKLEDGDFYVSFFCGRQMILALKNRLALDLMNEAVSFYQFPHTLPKRLGSCQEREQLRTLSQRLMEACGHGGQEELYHAYVAVQCLLDPVITAYLDYARRERPVREQIPFCWRVYRERPQLCYTLAARLIEEIYIALEYEAGGYLPSYGVMAERYQVSLSTVRRTVEMMEQLGVVTSLQGTGTRVNELAPNPSRFESAAVKKILTMLFEVLQILQITLDNLLTEYLPAAAADLQGSAAAKALWAGELGFAMLFSCVNALLRASSNHPLQEIWGRLYEALLLGLPLLEAETPLPSDACPKALAGSLEAGDWGAAKAHLKELLYLAVSAADNLRTRAII